MAKKLRNFLKSFTLIELIIVIAIIAVLGVAAFLVLTQWMSKGRDAQRISDLSTIKTALDIALSKNDELPLPDEANELLYSGTEILYQGKFGDTVVVQIGTLNKVPKDRVHGEYDYSILEDMRTYKIKANMENEQYKVSFANQVMAQEEYYRYVGKDIKGVVVLDKFVYLPSMFITGYVSNSYDLKDGSLNVFLGSKGGEVLTAGVASLDSKEIIEMLTGLGLNSSTAVKIVDQTLPQARASCEVTSQTINTRIYEIGKLAHSQSSLVELAPVTTVNGTINYKQLFVCNNGTISVSGEEIAELVCNEGNLNIAGVCKVGLIGDNTNGRSWSDGTYATSCKNYINPVSGKNYVGATGNGVYKVSFPDLSVRKIYCDMTTNGGGRSVVYTPSAYTSFPQELANMFSGSIPRMESNGLAGGSTDANITFYIYLLGSTELNYSAQRNDCSHFGAQNFKAYDNSGNTYWAGVLDAWLDTLHKYNASFIAESTCSTSHVVSTCKAVEDGSINYLNKSATFPSSSRILFILQLGKYCANSRMPLIMIR